ncbi:MAG: reverse transcriptase domain-containing protein [Candidatus Moraniibacteriota bacterium]
MLFDNLYQIFFGKKPDFEVKEIQASLNFWIFYFYFCFFTFQSPKFRVYKLEDFNPIKNTRKFRTIHNPNLTMRLIHRAFVRNVLRSKELINELPVGLRFATGGITGWSPLRNVEKHKNGRYFYLLDIHSFYNNIDGDRLLDILCMTTWENRKKLSKFLKKYCFLKSGTGLKTGAPASVDLANIFAAYLLDAPLAEICEKNDLRFTRFLDDLAFSSLKPIGKRVRKKIRQVIIDAGLQISHKKSAVIDLAEKRQIIITGVGLKFRGETFLPRNYLRKINGAIHLYEKGLIPFEIIQGMMGAFFSVTRKRSPYAFRHKSESEVVLKFREMRKLHK